jgi:hypothetical protein
MKKTTLFFSFFFLVFLFVKQDANASVLPFVRDTTVVDTATVEYVETLIDLDDPEVAYELKKIKTLSIIAISLTIPIITIVPAAILGFLAYSKAKKYREIFEDMPSTDPNYEALRKIMVLNKWGVITPLLPTFLLILGTILGAELNGNNDGAVITLGFIAGMAYLLFEWLSFGTNRLFD